MKELQPWLPLIIETLVFFVAVASMIGQIQKDRRITIKEIRAESEAKGEATGKLMQVVNILQDTAITLQSNIDRLQNKYDACFTAIKSEIQTVDDKVGVLTGTVIKNSLRLDYVEKDVETIKKKIS